jgi:3-oxoacyl-[acyl-carrier protein] reductase
MALAPAPPTLVVLNAGVCCQGTIDALPLEAFYETFQLNLITPLLIARDAIACWRHLGLEGHLVFVASQAGLPGAAPAGEAIYAASKAGLLGALRALAAECGPSVRVNAVAPGNVRTRGELRLLRRLAQTTGQSPGALYKQVAASAPIGRWLRPAEIARAILFLHDSVGMTGEVLTVTGGGYAAPRSSPS